MEENHYNFDVVVIGNVGIDTNIYFTGEDIDSSIESNFTENIDYVGQAGGYTSRGFARLGYRTAFIGYVGDDYSGRFILEEFQQDGINTDAVFIDPAGTSRSINFMYPDGRRKNFYDGKSHMVLEPDFEICERILKGARLVHFHIPNWARKLFPLIDKHRTKISCDIQDVINMGDDYRKVFIEESDILFFSAVNHISPEKLIKKLLMEFSDKIIVSGMGKQGCAIGYKNNVKFYNALELDQKVIDTNGAGDGLAVGFLSAYILENYNVLDSLLRGQISARYTCSQKASSSDLITSDLLNYYYSRLKGTENGL